MKTLVVLCFIFVLMKLFFKTGGSGVCLLSMKGALANYLIAGSAGEPQAQ